MWTYNLMGRFLTAGPEQTVYLMFYMQGLKPVGKVSTMVAYGFIFSWATFWGRIPMAVFSQDFQRAWNAMGDAVQSVFRLF